MDGQITGLGVFKGTDGSEYHGTFLNGMRQGKGELRDSLGFFVGFFEDDLRTGYGKQIYKNMKFLSSDSEEEESEENDTVYEGQFVRDKR